MKKREICLHVNGERHTLTVAANTTLLHALREDLNFTETKYGCGTGECGACTVLIDGTKAILACMTLAATMDGKHITTTAGLARDGKLHPVQQAFVDESGIQCGYCTPGMVMTAYALLQADRIARARGVPAERVRALVGARVTPPWLGFIGQARVNVLQANLALDAALPKGHTAAP